MSLSPRLLTLRSHYRDHPTVWDIGCDHGKLGLSFLIEESVRNIHLVDPSLAVVEKLRSFIDSYITAEKYKIQLHHKKGQEIETGPERKLVLIAGMGGREILSIASHLDSLLSEADDLVISPHRDLLLLREEFSRSDFFLGKETLVKDEGHYYQVLALHKRGGMKVHPYGEDVFRGPQGEEYRKQQLSVFSAHKDVRSGAYVSYLQGLTQCF